MATILRGRGRRSCHRTIARLAGLPGDRVAETVADAGGGGAIVRALTAPRVSTAATAEPLRFAQTRPRRLASLDAASAASAARAAADDVEERREVEHDHGLAAWYDASASPSRASTCFHAIQIAGLDGGARLRVPRRVVGLGAPHQKRRARRRLREFPDGLALGRLRAAASAEVWVWAPATCEAGSGSASARPAGGRTT